MAVNWNSFALQGIFLALFVFRVYSWSVGCFLQPNATFIVSAPNGSTCIFNYNITTDEWEPPGPGACAGGPYMEDCIVPGLYSLEGYYGIGTTNQIMQLWSGSSGEAGYLRDFNISMSRVCRDTKLAAFGNMNGYGLALGINKTTGAASLYKWDFGWSYQNNASLVQSVIQMVCSSAKRVGMFVSIYEDPQSTIYCDKVSVVITRAKNQPPLNATIMPNPFYRYRTEGNNYVGVFADGRIQAFRNLWLRTLKPPVAYDRDATFISSSSDWVGLFDPKSAILQVYGNVSYDGSGKTLYWNYYKKIKLLPKGYSIRNFLMAQEWIYCY
jgi:hypothetical protein